MVSLPSTCRTANMFELSLARKHHAGEIAALSRDHIETGLGWSWTAERVTANISGPEDIVLAGVCADCLAGFAIMHFGIEEARLNLLAVKPEYQREGLGQQMVLWLEKSALTAGISVIYLEVRASNQPALAFYQKLGYARVAEMPGYYGGGESALQMAHDLWREVPAAS